MTKSCATCLYGIGNTDMVRHCSWFAATQLGRKVKAIGPFWLQTQQPLSPDAGAECPAHEEN